jgi:WD40 repeat protein
MDVPTLYIQLFLVIIKHLAFSPDGKILATGSDAETIQLWDFHTGECLKTFKGDKPYEGIKIKGITGLTPPTIANLKALGAVEF